MKKEVSDRVVILLLIIAILLSIGGTVIVYDSVQDFRSNIDELGSKHSSTGMVTLIVPEDVPESVDGGGANDESF